MNGYTQILLAFLKSRQAAYENQGFIPTIDLLIKDLESEEQGEDTPETVDQIHGVGDAPEGGETN